VPHIPLPSPTATNMKMQNAPMLCMKRQLSMSSLFYSSLFCSTCPNPVSEIRAVKCPKFGFGVLNSGHCIKIRVIASPIRIRTIHVLHIKTHMLCAMDARALPLNFFRPLRFSSPRQPRQFCAPENLPSFGAW